MACDYSVSIDYSTELMTCEELHAILHLVLQAGNIMNAVSIFLYLFFQCSFPLPLIFPLFVDISLNPLFTFVLSFQLLLQNIPWCFLIRKGWWLLQHWADTDWCTLCVRRVATQAMPWASICPRFSLWLTRRPTSLAWTCFILWH